MEMKIDSLDVKILKALQSEGRISITDLSQRVNLSKTPCAERVRRLERAGYISGYCAALDPIKLGLPYVVFVQVTLDQTRTDVLDAFNAAVARIPEVEACHMIAGGFDYLIKIRARDMEHYRTLLGDRLGALPGVRQTHTYPVMETVVDSKGLNPLTF